MSKIYLRIVRQYGTSPTTLETMLDQCVILGGDGGKMGIPSLFSGPAAQATWNAIPVPVSGAMGVPLSIYKGDGTRQLFTLAGAFARVTASAFASNGGGTPQYFDVTGPVFTGGVSSNSTADTTFPRRYAFAGWSLGSDGVTYYSIFKTANDFSIQEYEAAGGAFGTLLTTGTGAYSQQWQIPGACIATRPVAQVGLGLISPWGAGSTPGLGSAAPVFKAMVDITYVIDVPDSLFAYEQTAASDWYFSIAEKGSGSIFIPNNTALAGVTGNTTMTEVDANVYYLSFSAIRNPALLDSSTGTLKIVGTVHPAVAGTKGYIWNDNVTARFPVASRTDIIAGFSPIVNSIPVDTISNASIPPLPAY